MIIVSTMTFRIMTVIIVIVPMSSVFIIPLFIFFFTNFIGFIPRCLDKYFECRVQVDDDDEEDKGKDSKYDKESYLHGYNRKPGYNRRNNKRKYEKYHRDDERTKVEEYHRIIELHRYSDMSNCHTCRSRERLDSRLSFKDNKEFCIGKTHIEKKCKKQIYTHSPGNRDEVFFPKQSKEEDVEGNNRKRAKYRNDIMDFKKRKKVAKSIKYSLEAPVSFFSI